MDDSEGEGRKSFFFKTQVLNFYTQRKKNDDDDEQIIQEQRKMKVQKN